jgi:xylulokinase
MLVGCGAVAPGDAMIALGTTGLLTLTTRRLETAAAGPHFGTVAGEGAVLWAANVLACGQLLAWFQQELGPAVDFPCGSSGTGAPAVRTPAVRTPDFRALDAAAARIPPGSRGLVALPHLMGRRTPTPDPTARGVFVGLTPSHTAADLYRGLLEAVGYALRRGFDPIRPQVRRVIATAGGASSPLWRQILADILETAIEHHPAASGALGIAFLAGHATGRLASFEALRHTWLAEPTITNPDAAAQAVYRARYQAYCLLEEVLGPVYALLDNASA